MASRRILKIAQAIREVVAMSLLTDLKDPRVEHVTITSVTVSGDGRQAKVFFTVFGNNPAKERKALAGLSSAAGFLQQKCARRIDARYTPKLQFAVDEGVKNLAAITEILARERVAGTQADIANDSAPSDEGANDDASENTNEGVSENTGENTSENTDEEDKSNIVD